MLFAHLDSDWYESTRDCLQFVYPALVEHRIGEMQVDDYHYWNGTKLAVDHYFANTFTKTNSPERSVPVLHDVPHEKKCGLVGKGMIQESLTLWVFSPFRPLPFTFFFFF